jgi:hypothetical protein
MSQVSVLLASKEGSCPAILKKGPTYQVTADLTVQERGAPADVSSGVLRTSIVRESGQIRSLAHRSEELGDIFLAEMPLT